MKGKKCAALLTAAVLFTAALTGCSGTPGDASGSDVSDSGKPKLKVATNAEFDPWEYIENGEYVGADMDIMRAIEMCIRDRIRIILFGSLKASPDVHRGSIEKNIKVWR